MIICPSYLALNDLILYEDKIKGISFGAQNVSSEREGSFTGEVSISMLESINCKWVIIGHSERRLIMKETESEIAKKMQLVYKSKLTPILCVGETFLQKKNKETHVILEQQIITAFESVDFKDSIKPLQFLAN